MPPGYNHPARVAERIATLDLVSNGRVDWGTGESASRVELEGFGIDPDREARDVARGRRAGRQHDGDGALPRLRGQVLLHAVRNVVPKPVQKPHPPLWVACSNRETIHAGGAQLGIGALTFAFVDPAEAGKWVDEYYEIIKSDECVPIGHAVNPNIAMVTGFSCHADAAEARAPRLDGFQLLRLSRSATTTSSASTSPGAPTSGSEFEAARGQAAAGPGGGSGIGTPDELRAHLRAFEDAGVDQVVFIQQGGKQQARAHLRGARAVRRRGDAGVQGRPGRARRQEAEELAPYIEAALARKKRMAPVAHGGDPDRARPTAATSCRPTSRPRARRTTSTPTSR